MNRVLISWFAFNNDFKRGESGMMVDPEGPTMDFHKHHFEIGEYEKHILLSAQRPDDQRLPRVYTALRNVYPTHKVEQKILGPMDVINHQAIMSKLEPFLETLKEYEIDIFVSPGTPAMQTCWFIIHMTKGLKTRLLQVRPTKFTKDKKQSELLEINIDRDPFVSSATIKHVEQQKPIDKTDEEYLISESLEPIYSKARRIAQAGEVTVLITGPSGSGKEHLARYVHDESPRAKEMFKAVNCSAFTAELLRSELFGHEKGSFTGAEKKKIGILQECEGGTIFLDEIGDISPFLQQALLRVLQQKVIQPVGSTEIIPIDVRFIAATNADLQEKAKQRLFRWDLFYRLAVVELDLPTLFDRGLEEIKGYIDFFIKTKAKKFRQPQLKLSKEVKDVLYSYTYPGNIRELENIIERLYVLSDDGKAVCRDLPKRLINPSDESTLLMATIEKKHIERVLKFNNFNQNKTARDLGVVINTLRKKIKDYQIEILD